MKEKYIIEYHDIKNRLLIYKNKIEQLNNKYSDNCGKSLIMEVIRQLYDNRKGGSYESEDRFYYEDILINYEENCGVTLDDLCDMMDLFIERKKDKRRLGFLKGLAVRETFK